MHTPLSGDHYSESRGGPAHQNSAGSAGLVAGCYNAAMSSGPSIHEVLDRRLEARLRAALDENARLRAELLALNDRVEEVADETPQVVPPADT